MERARLNAYKAGGFKSLREFKTYTVYKHADPRISVDGLGGLVYTASLGRPEQVMNVSGGRHCYLDSEKPKRDLSGCRDFMDAMNGLMRKALTK
jgi:hypothetical protein